MPPSLAGDYAPETGGFLGVRRHRGRGTRCWRAQAESTARDIAVGTQAEHETIVLEGQVTNVNHVSNGMHVRNGLSRGSLRNGMVCAVRADNLNRQVYRSWSDVSDSIKDLFRLMDLHASAGRPKEAEELLHQILHAGPHLERRKGSMLWNTLLKAFANAGDVAGAMALQEEQCRRGIRLNLKHFGKLAEVMVRGSSPEDAVDWLRRAEDAGFELDLAQYAMMVIAFVQRGDLRSAERWLDEMLSSGKVPSAAEFTKLMEAYVKADARLVGEERVWRVFEKMVVAGVTPNATAYGVVVYAYAQRNSSMPAVHWLWRARAAGVVPDLRSYRAVIRSLAEDGRLHDASQLYAELEAGLCADGLGPDAQSCSFIVKVAADTGDVQRATALLDKAAAEGITLDVPAYAAVIGACARGGDRLGTQAWFQRMVEAKVQPRGRSDFNTLINACAHVGDVKRATAWFDCLLEAGYNPEEYTYTVLFKTCAAAQPKATKVAEKFFCAMVSTGIEPRWPTIVQLDSVVGTERRHLLYEALGMDRRIVDRDIEENWRRPDDLLEGARESQAEGGAPALSGAGADRPQPQQSAWHWKPPPSRRRGDQRATR